MKGFCFNLIILGLMRATVSPIWTKPDRERLENLIFTEVKVKIYYAN